MSIDKKTSELKAFMGDSSDEDEFERIIGNSSSNSGEDFMSEMGKDSNILKRFTTNKRKQSDTSFKVRSQDTSMKFVTNDSSLIEES